MIIRIQDIERQIIELEKQALHRWCNGDPSGFLEISVNDVVYFDPFQDRRIDGLPALTAYYESIRGKVSATRFEIDQSTGSTGRRRRGTDLQFRFVWRQRRCVSLELH
jgi:hypothetical protein